MRFHVDDSPVKSANMFPQRWNGWLLHTMAQLSQLLKRHILKLLYLDFFLSATLPVTMLVGALPIRWLQSLSVHAASQSRHFPSFQWNKGHPVFVHHLVPCIRVQPTGSNIPPIDGISTEAKVLCKFTCDIWFLVYLWPI